MKCVQIWQTSSCVFIVNFKHILHLVLAFQLLTMINNEQVLDSWGGGGFAAGKVSKYGVISGP